MSISGGSPISAQVQLDLGQLKAQVDQAVALTDKLGTSLKAIPSPAPKIDTQLLEQSTAQAQGILGRLQTEIKALSGGQVSLDTAGLERGAQAAQASLKTLTGGLLDLGSTAKLAAGGFLALEAAAVAALVKLGAEYEEAMRTIRVRTGESGAALADLEESLKRVAATSKRSVGELADVIVTLNRRLDETGPALEATTALVAKFAKATGGDAAQAAKDVSAFFVGWHVSTEEQRQALDGLVAISQKTGTAMQELIGPVNELGPLMRAAGFSANETATLVGKFNQAGLDATTITFGLRSAINKFAEEGKNPKAALEELIEALKNTDDATLALTVATQYFGQRGGAAILDAARSGRLSLAGLAEDADNAGGALDHAANDATTAAGKFKVSMETIRRAFEPAGEAAFGFGASILEGIVKVLGIAGQAIDKYLELEGALILKTLQAARAIKDGIGGLLPGGAPAGDGLTSEQQALVASRRDAFAASDAANLPAANTGEAASADKAREATDKLTAAHAAQAAGAKDAATAENSLAKQLLEAQTTEQAADILTQIEQAKTLEQAITSLTDRGLAAEIAALRNLALTTKEAGVANDAYDQALDQARAGLAADATAKQAQAEAQRVTTKAQQEAEAATKSLADAQAKAANEGASVYQKRLFELADAALPGLTAAETAQLKALEDLNDQTGLLALVMAKLGLSEADAKALLAGTNTEFEARKKQLADTTKATSEHGAAVKSLGDIYADEVKGRIGSALGALSSGVDAGTAALAKQQEASGNATGALETLTAQYGVSKQQADAWAGALQQGGAAAQIAQAQMALLTATTGAAGAQLFGLKEQLSALTTFAHDPTTGTIRLKVEIDIEQAQRQLVQLVQTYQDTFNRNLNTPGTKGFLGQELEAQKTYQGQLNETAKGFSDLTAQGLDAAHKLDDAWAASAKQLATDYSAAVAQTNAAFKSLPTLVNPQIGTVPSFSGTRTDLLGSVAAGIQGDQTAARSVADDPKAFLALARATQDLTNQKQELYDGFAQTIGEATDSHTKALQSISDSTNQAIKSAGDAQGAALRSLSSAMQAFNDQQAQANANASITLQNAQLQAAGLDASTVGGQTNAQRLQQIQQQGLAALQQTGQAAQLNQARVGANVASNQAQDQLTKAVNDGAAQTREANKAYAKQVGDAAGSLAKALYALQQTYERASEDQAQARKDAIAAQSKAIAAAQSAEESRAKQLREQEAQQQLQQQHQREQLLRQDQDVRKKFLDEDADRAKQRQDADKQFQTEFLKQVRALGNLEGLLGRILAKVPTAQENAKATAEVLQLGPQTIIQNIGAVQETGVDYTDYLGISLLRRVRSGV